MKKKIISLLFAFCLFVPCLMLAGCDLLHTGHSYATEWTIDATHHWHKCNGCKEVKDKETHKWNNGVVVTEATGHAEGVKLLTCLDCNYSKTVAIPKNIYLVTATEWESAFVLDGVTNIKIEDTIGNLYIVDRERAYNNLNGIETYVSIENDKYVKYIKDDDVWTKFEIDKDTYDGLYDELYEVAREFLFFDFSDFEYNPITKAYEADNIDGTEVPQPNKMQIFFENQKIIKVSLTAEGTTQSVFFTYGNQIIGLPNYMVTAEEWANALVFDVENYQLDMVQTNQTMTADMICKKDGATRYINMNGAMTLVQYVNFEDNKYYIYNYESEAWTKKEVLQEDYYDMSLETAFSAIAEKDIFDKFVFNFESGAYEAENVQIDGTLFTKMQIFFKLDKVEKIVCDMVDDSQEIHAEGVFTYNDETLELPTAYTTLATPFVTETELRSALDFLNIENYQMTASISGETLEGQLTMKDGDVLYTATVLDEQGNIDEIYSNIDDSVYYIYTKDVVWTKSETTASEYRKVNMAYDFFTYFDMDEIIPSLTYNQFEESYEAHNLTFDGTPVDTLSLYFEDLKLSKVILDTSDGVMGLHFTYNDEPITLPSLEEFVITEAQWKSAIVFEGVTQYQLTATQDGSELMEYVVDGDLAYSNNLDSHVYFSKEDEKYYMYENETGDWVKEEITQEEYNEHKNPLGLEFLVERFAEFEYNQATGAYEAENVEGFDMQAKPTLGLTFKDGKLIKVTMTIEDATSTVLVEYEEVVLTLPTI